MSCDETREHLLNVEASERTGIAHLSVCAECRDFAAALADAEGDVLEHVEEFALRDGFDQAWTRAVEAPPETRSSAMSRYFHTASIAAVAAAVVLLGMVPTLLPDTQSGSDDANTQVVVAAQDLAAGHTITGADLSSVEMPEDSVARGTFSRDEDLIGRVVEERLLANDFIRCERLEGGCDGSSAVRLDRLEIRVGKSVVLDMPMMPKGFEVGPNGGIGVSTLRRSKLRIWGLEEGETSVTLHFDGRRDMTYDVDVLPAAELPTPKENVIVRTIETTAPVELPDIPVAMAVSNPYIAEILETRDAKRPMLRAKKIGVTDLVVVFETGAPIIYAVEVHPTVPHDPGKDATVTIPRSESFTSVEITCPNGFRQRGTFLGGKATVPGVPDQNCDLLFKGGLPAVNKISGGQSLTCSFVGGQSVCE